MIVKAEYTRTPDRRFGRKSRSWQKIGQAITEMDTVTQMNAALVEEAAAAASLQDQTVGLLQVVSVFKTSGGRAPLLAG